MLEEYYEMLKALESFPKTWSPFKLIKRKMLKYVICCRICDELDRQIKVRVS